MDGIAGPKLSPAPPSPAHGWNLSSRGASGLATASAILLFVYLAGRFVCLCKEEDAAADERRASLSAPTLPVVRPLRAVSVPVPVPVPALPVFVHMEEPAGGEAGSRRTPECAVCLSEFMEREAGRLLPGCGHGFHEHCIATWLQLNMTCPICRAAVAVAAK